MAGRPAVDADAGERLRTKRLMRFHRMGVTHPTNLQTPPGIVQIGSFEVPDFTCSSIDRRG